MRFIRVRSVQPDTSFGMVVAGIVLLVIITLGWLNWFTLLICLLIPAVVNLFTVGRTHKDEITIEKDH